MAKHHWLKDRALRLQNTALCGLWGVKPELGVLLRLLLRLLLRYQATNERAFFRAKKELETMQKARGKFVSQNQPKLFDTPTETDAPAAPTPVKRSVSPEPPPQKKGELTAEAEIEARSMAAELKIPFPYFMELLQQSSSKSLNG